MATVDYETNFDTTNPELLDEELRAALGNRIVGISGPRKGKLRVHFISDPTTEEKTQVGTVLATHSPTGDSKFQARRKEIKALITAAEGKRFDAVTAGERNAVIAGVMFLMNVIDKDGKITPFEDWGF
jgi:hypothetical protein